jgi:hypothetical protein
MKPLLMIHHVVIGNHIKIKIVSRFSTKWDSKLTRMLKKLVTSKRIAQV